MGTPASGQEPNPGLIFETFIAYQRTSALKAAIELDLFTEIAKGNRSVEALSNALPGSPRAVRILCDYLAIIGFLQKNSDQYSLTSESSIFLDRNSPAYIGGAAKFLLDPKLLAPFQDLAEIVKTGRTTMPDEGTVSYDNPIWVEFAEAMAPMQFMAAKEIAAAVAGEVPMRVLDIAAGHGLFGIMIAQQNPQAQIVALDWPDVLAVATDNAKKLGIADRHSLLPGDAFTVDYGGPYDLILVTNFFHHFDIPTCEKLIAKIAGALKPGGKCATLDFVPNEDRVSPPQSATFAMMMLGSTASGDAYTLSEYKQMFDKAGFVSTELRTLSKSPGTLLVSTKE